MKKKQRAILLGFAGIALSVLLQAPLSAMATSANAGITEEPGKVLFPKGTTEDISTDSEIKDETVYSIHFDPNEGQVPYGVIGQVGARAENDVNNEVYRGTKYHLFPSYYMTLKDEDGNPMFPGAGESGYDYTEMLTYAIDTEANNHVAGRTFHEIRVEEGVYYFGSTIRVWGQMSINGVYGKTIFVCEKDETSEKAAENTALFKASSSNTYYQGSITDITFVAKDSHAAFAQTNAAEVIQENVLSPEVNPVDGYHCFEGMNISWFRLENCTISGFTAPLAGVKGHMCTRINRNTFGPCKVAFKGTHFIDSYIYNNHFYGGIIDRDGHKDMALFTSGLGPNLTTMNNNLIEKFVYGKGTSDTSGVTYTNNTYRNVYEIHFYAPGTQTNAVANCLFEDNTYEDIAAVFEAQGYTPYSAENTGENAYVIHTNGYDDKQSEYNQMKAGNRIGVIKIAGGTAITQCKFKENNMDKTDLLRCFYVSNDARKTICPNTMVQDNAFELNRYQKDDIFRDNINLKDNKVSGSWKTKYFLSKKTTEESCIYYDPAAKVRIDMSCFLNPQEAKPLGYATLGTVGTDEAKLDSEVSQQYYRDIKSGKNVVYLSDFGATADDGSGDSYNIQKAFDTIANTGDILVVEGTYTITTPILLRGGKTYRVVCNGGKTSQNNTLVGGGFSLDVSNENLVKTGAFVQDASDSGKVSGYFINMNVYPNNIGSVQEVVNRKGVVFYQVRFDCMNIDNYRFGNMESVFEECTFTESVIEEGYSHYNSFGLMKRCIFSDSVIKNVYATGSMCDYGVGYTYAYFFVDTDLVNSVMRGSWIEFMQMSNGFRLNGDGNSRYVGNIWDYVWNFQFGRNDMFVGNTLTHCATTSITNHLAGPDNIPRDKWTVEIKAGNITQMHVSDGVKIVGNVFGDGLTKYTTYFNFDGRTSLYRDGDQIVTSISDARIAANLVGGNSISNEMVQLLCSPTLLKENCRNNRIDLTFASKEKRNIPENAAYVYDAENIKEHIIPGTLVWLWEKEGSCLHYYGNDKTQEKTVTPVPEKPLTFDLKYRLEDTSVQNENVWTYNYDFAESETLQIADPQGNVQEGADLLTAYKNRVLFVSPLNENHKEARVAIVSGNDIPHSSVSDNSVLHSESAYMNSELKENKSRNELPPIYMFADADCRDKVKTFSATMKIPTEGNPIQDFPVIIYGEDDTYYYGMSALVRNRYTLRAQTFKIRKDVNGVVYGVNANTGGVVPRERSSEYKIGSADISSIEVKTGNNISGNLYFDGTDTEVTKENSELVLWNPEGYNTPVLGMEIECVYGYVQNAVEIFVVFDFADAIQSTDGDLKVSKRKISLGTHSIEDMKTLPGLLFFNDAWIEKIQYEVDNDLDRTSLVSFTLKEEEQEVCGHVFKEYIRVVPTCKAGGYNSYICSRCKTQISYEELEPVPHVYSEEKVEPTQTQTGYIKYTCQNCDYSYMEELKYETEDTPADKPEDKPEVVVDEMQKCTQAILNTNTNKGDVEGSTFAPLFLKASGKKKSVKLTWKKVKEADGYILYGAQCGEKMKEIKKLGASKKSYTQKELKKAKYYKYMVVAYKNENGKQIPIATSTSVHAVTKGRKYASPTKVTVKTKAITLKKGKSKNIKASYKLPKGKKTKIHIAKFRYESTNEKVVIVSNKGKLKAKKKGTAYIYVYVQNGVFAKIKVKVK